MTAASHPPLFAHRHLLGIRDLSPPDIEFLLDRADEAVAISRRHEKKTSTLRGRTQINLFFEASTRTQSSFELAGKRLGADVMNMSVGLLLGEEGRDADRHGDDAQRHAARHPDHPPPVGRRRRAARAEGRLLGRQRRRRRPRASDPGAARRADHPPRQGPHRGLTWRSAATSCTRVARSNILLLNALGATRARRRALDAAAARHRADGRRGRARHARGLERTPTSS